MKKIMLLTICAFLISFTQICWSGQKLTEKLATELIREAEGYPKLVFITLREIEANSPIGQDIQYFVAKGYMLPPKSGSYGEYEITKEGARLIAGCRWDSLRGQYASFQVFTHKKDVIKIKQILTDSRSGTAVVRYQVGFIATPYFDRLKSLDRNKVENAPEFSGRP